MEKSKLLKDVINALKKNIESIEKNVETMTQALIDAPGAMQSHSDTTKSQMGHMVDALQKSLSEQSHTLSILQGMTNSSSSIKPGHVKIGTLVEVADDNNEKGLYLILPAGGGMKIGNEDGTVMVVTPRAPIAATIIGKKRGDVTELKIGHLTKRLTILDIQ